jgi:hypothetical protein
MRVFHGIGLGAILASWVAFPWTADAQKPPDPQNSAALFNSIATVLLSPRCLNCHTIGDFPRQGDDRHAHLFGVSRGPDDRGLPWARCTACHGTANNNGSGIPGRPDWHLAPLSMAWEGLTVLELCHRLLDPAQNGGRTATGIKDHVVHDQQFVAWAWSPGRDIAGMQRSVPPIPRDQFSQLMEQWIADASPCPQ